MNLLTIALLLVMAAGILPLFLLRRFRLMNTLGLLLLSCGCGLGLVSAFDALLQGAVYAIELDNFLLFSATFALDSIAAFFLVPVFGVALLGRIYSFHYLNDPSRAMAIAICHLFYSLLVVSMALVVYSSDLFSFALSWELMSISSFFLVLYDHRKKETRKAAVLYFGFTQAGALLIFAGFGVLFTQTGSLAFEAFSELSTRVQLAVFIFLMLGFGSKAGIFPLHIWLPAAHPAAPSHVSAIMSGVMIKIGIYGVIRFYSLLDSNALLVGQVVLAFGIVTGLFGVIQALGQHHLKRLLAYSSVENIGIILIGLGIGMIGRSLHQPAMTLMGFCGAFLHVLNHALFKSLLFLGAGSVMHVTGHGLMDRMGGLLKPMRVTGLTFLAGAVAISGLPPFNGFIGELLIYCASFQGVGLTGPGMIVSGLAILALALIGGLALICFTRAFGIVFLGEPRSESVTPSSESGVAMLIPMVILAVICLLTGVFPAVALHLSLPAVQSLAGTVNIEAISDLQAISLTFSRGSLGFIGLVLSLAGLRQFLYRKKPITLSTTWGCGFTQASPRIQYTGASYVSTLLGFLKPVAPLSISKPGIDGHFPQATRYHAELEDAAEAGLRMGLIRPLLLLFRQLRWIQHGEIHLYIGYILLSVILLLLFI